MIHSLAYFAVWFTVFALPWEVVLMIPGVGTISRLVGLLAFALGVLAVIVRGRVRAPNRFHALGVAFLVWGSLSYFWAIDPDVALAQVNRNLQLLALVWLLWEFSDTPGRLRGLYQSYVFGAYVAVISTLVNYRAGVAEAGSRFAAAEGANPNDLGFVLVLALPIAWHLALTGKNFWLRWLNRLYLPLGLLGVFLTASRSGLVVGAVALSIVPWTLPRLSFRIKAAAVVVAAVCVATAVAYVPDRSWERLGTTGEQLTEGTLNDRTLIWKAGFSVYPQHPIIGFGTNGYAKATKSLLGAQRGAHNAYVSVLVELGIVGLLLFLAVLFNAFLAARSSPWSERKLLLVLFFTLVLGLTPRAYEGKKPTWLILTLLHASAVAVVPRVRETPVDRFARPVTVRRPQILPRTA